MELPLAPASQEDAVPKDTDGHDWDKERISGGAWCFERNDRRKKRRAEGTESQLDGDVRPALMGVQAFFDARHHALLSKTMNNGKEGLPGRSKTRKSESLGGNVASTEHWCKLARRLTARA